MDDHAARVLALVSEPEYSPLTLKAMARHFKISDDDYPGFRNAVKGLIKAGKLDLAKNKTIRKGAWTGLGDDHRDVPPEFEGVRVRPAERLDRQGRADLHPSTTPAAMPPPATR